VTQGTIIKIPLAHPALAGHFPGHPIVPGVTILERVAAAFASFMSEPVRITGFQSIKFVAPLAPEQTCNVSFARKGEGQATFDVQSDAGRIVNGSLTYVLVE